MLITKENHSLGLIQSQGADGMAVSTELKTMFTCKWVKNKSLLC